MFRAERASESADRSPRWLRHAAGYIFAGINFTTNAFPAESGEFIWGVKFFYGQKCGRFAIDDYGHAHWVGRCHFSDFAHRGDVPNGASHQYYLRSFAGALVCAAMCDADWHSADGSDGNSAAGFNRSCFRGRFVGDFIPALFGAAVGGGSGRSHWHRHYRRDCVLSGHGAAIWAHGPYLDVLCASFCERHFNWRFHCVLFAHGFVAQWDVGRVSTKTGGESI